MVALLGDGAVGKFVVSVDGEQLVEHLASLVRGALARAKVEGRLLRLTNAKRAQLPTEERVNDVLRDCEEVIAVPRRAFQTSSNEIHTDLDTCMILFIENNDVINTFERL